MAWSTDSSLAGTIIAGINLQREEWFQTLRGAAVEGSDFSVITLGFSDEGYRTRLTGSQTCSHPWYHVERQSGSTAQSFG